ncbi:MAG: hypothetical protein U9O64_10110 [Campylobacterota bacterium]|nr:hypothetical protein [Campylobacterota bacterium]
MNEKLTPIHHKIYTLRGKKVMFDFDLEELNQVETQQTDEKIMGFLKP